MEEIKIGQHWVCVHRLSKEELAHSKQQHVLISMVQKKVDTSITQIEHDSLGKPFLTDFPSVSISISHSADWIAFAISKYGEIGIDLEIENPKITKAAIHFLNIHEQTRFPLPNLRTLHLIWGAKEAIFKFLGGKINSLQENIEILSIDYSQHHIHAKCGSLALKCDFQLLHNQTYLVVCATEFPTQ